jgi:predicted nuclease of predicted toxin-antitoxin system
MLVLADENQHPFVVARLREAGLAVEWVRESSRGAKDSDILHRPDIGSLVLVTDDRDFGDLIFNRGYPVPAVLLYLRLNRADPDAIAARVLALLEGEMPSGQFITITKDGERKRPFSSGASNA